MTHSSKSPPLSAALAARILRALGLGSGAALAISMAACGGNVVIDAESGEGGAGGTSSSSHSSSSSGTAATCDGVTPPSGVELRYLCLPGNVIGPCPTLSEATPKLMEQVFGTEECLGSGSCCGPTGDGCIAPSDVNTCCYNLGISFNLCEGRPFTAHGEVVTAAAVRSADWLDSKSPEPSLEGLDEATRAALADCFTRAALFEHASIASFARFALELLSIGAPPSLITAAQQAMADEVRHAHLCFGLASAYAGAPVGPAPLPMENVPLRKTLVEMAVATAIEGCVNETLSALVAAESAARAEDPAVKAALESIAEDEMAHAELAWRTIAWARREGGVEITRALQVVFDQAQPTAEEVGVENAADASALEARGWISPEEKRAILRRGLAEVVLPSARALFATRAEESRMSARL